MSGLLSERLRGVMCAETEEKYGAMTTKFSQLTAHAVVQNIVRRHDFNPKMARSYMAALYACQCALKAIPLTTLRRKPKGPSHYVSSRALFQDLKAAGASERDFTMGLKDAEPVLNALKQTKTPHETFLAYKFLNQRFALLEARFIHNARRYDWPKPDCKMQFLAPHGALSNNDMLMHLGKINRKFDRLAGYDNDAAAAAMAGAIQAHIQMMDGIEDRLMNWRGPCSPCKDNVFLQMLAAVFVLVSVVVSIMIALSDNVESDQSSLSVSLGT